MDAFTTQRFNMVESQIRPNDVTDRRIIDTMLQLPREHFVPTSLKTMAYMDEEIRIKEPADGKPARALLRPMIIAKLVQLADVSENELVLDVGCTTGYSTAILASLSGTVVGLECDELMVNTATAVLEKIRADNAVIVQGALNEGCAGEGPYDAILLNGYTPNPPTSLRDQLKPGGRLVVILSEHGFGCATIFERVGKGWSGRSVFNAAGPALPGFESDTEFVF